MNNIKLYFILIITLFPFSKINGEYFNSLNMKDGLSQSSVLSIYQDFLGRIWMGTLEGLSVYDGEKIISYKPWAINHDSKEKKVLVGNDIPRIIGNSEGNILIMSDHGLVKYDIYDETFTRILNNKVSGLTSYQGNCYILVEDSIFRYNETLDTLDFVFKSNVRDPRSILINDKGVYIGNVYGLYFFSKDFSEKKILLHDVEVWNLYESNTKEIWVGTVNSGAYYINYEHEITSIPFLTGHTVRAFCNDNYNNLWIGTFNGLYKYDLKEHTYEHYSHTPETGSLTHSSIYALLKDKQGTIWIGTYYGGANYVNPENELLTYYNYNPNREDCLNFPFVGDMVEDKMGRLWICLDGGGLNCLDRKTGKFKRFLAGKNSFLHNNLKSICYDSIHNMLYIGTHEGGLSRYDINNNKFYNYLADFKGWFKSPNNIIDKVVIYNGRLIVSARNGIFIQEPYTNQFELLRSGIYRAMDINNDNLWFTEDKYIHRLNLTNKTTETYSLDSINCKFRVTRILGNDNERVYFSTSGSGFFYYDNKLKRFIHYTVDNSSLLSNYCYNIADTQQGKLVITSDKGISLYNKDTGSFSSMGIDLGLPISSIVDGCGVYVCNNNQIYVGGTDGLISFMEKDFIFSNDKPQFYFSKLLINNTQIFPHDGTGVLNKALAFTHCLELGHDQNNLTFDFASSNYVTILRNELYEYKLEGFDKDWILTNKRTVHYTNLDPGKYILYVREKGSPLKARYMQEISLPIIIKSPWYNTWWAYILYTVLVSILLFSIYKILNTRRKLTLSLKLEKMEKQKLTEINQAKLLFFTNVSHEFRTPLTLIMSRLDALLNNPSLPQPFIFELNKIEKNAHHLMELISDLLDFRKMDQHKTLLHIKQLNISRFMNVITDPFIEYAKGFNIDITFQPCSHSLECFIDEKQMEKVFSNLISNAIKYTPANGKISIKQIEDNNYIYISIADNGIGIKEDELKSIFERFYQANNDNKVFLKGSPSTGIGLALAKSIVEAHHGEILVESKLNTGSKFTVKLPKGYKHFISDENVIIEHDSDKKDVDTMIFSQKVTEIEECTPILSPNTERNKILIVDDNEELLQILNKLFLPLYDVSLANNGKEALKAINNQMPDIIVSDVMMPEMSGTEMCLKIKQNIDLCHIPVILLTALGSTEHNIDGYKCGADDYITKPFNPRLLLIRCNNILRNRKLVQNKYAKEKDADINLLATNPLDKRFLETIIKIINEHLSEEEFDISVLCREIGMSRTSLHNKFKMLTNMTPNEFIISHKLKIAADMLTQQPYLQIVEVSDKLGFGSSRYFSRSFKSYFGVSPAKYRNKEIS